MNITVRDDNFNPKVELRKNPGGNQLYAWFDLRGKTYGFAVITDALTKGKEASAKQALYDTYRSLDT